MVRFLDPIIEERKRLFAGTVLANKNLFAGTDIFKEIDHKSFINFRQQGVTGIYSVG